MFLNGLTQPLWNTDPAVYFKISMSSVRANILEIFQQKRLAHGNQVFCRKAVNLMSILKEIQQASDQNLTIFQSVHLPSFSLPGSTSLHGPTGLHRRTRKKQRQICFSGEQILNYSSRNFHIDNAWLSLGWSTVEVLDAFLTTSMKVSSQNISVLPWVKIHSWQVSLCHRDDPPQLCLSGHSVMPKLISRSLMSMTVLPGSNSLGRVRSASAPASRDTLLGTGWFRSLGQDQLLSWFILRPKRLQVLCPGFIFFWVYQRELLSRGSEATDCVTDLQPLDGNKHR